MFLMFISFLLICSLIEWRPKGKNGSGPVGDIEVASFVSLSAISFPSIPVCIGTQMS